MAKTLSQILGLNLPGKGDLDWDGDVNSNFSVLESFMWQKMLCTPQGVVAGVRDAGAVGAFLSPGQPYFYKVTAINSFGETPASVETSVAMPGVAHPVRIIWTPVVGATGYRIYKSGTTNSETLLTQVGAVATFDDDGTLAAGVVTPPANNTTKVMTEADVVDGFHASQTPGGGQIPVLSADLKYPNGNGANIFNVSATDSDRLEGFHASQAPIASQIPVLRTDGKYPPANASLLTNLVTRDYIRWDVQGTLEITGTTVHVIKALSGKIGAIPELFLCVDKNPQGINGLELDIRKDKADGSGIVSIFSTNPKIFGNAADTKVLIRITSTGAELQFPAVPPAGFAYQGTLGPNATVQKGDRLSLHVIDIGGTRAGGDDLLITIPIEGE